MEGFIVPIRWDPFNNINIIMYTQYVIAYCFIMYYNTEVRIIAQNSPCSSLLEKENPRERHKSIISTSSQ